MGFLEIIQEISSNKTTEILDGISTKIAGKILSKYIFKGLDLDPFPWKGILLTMFWWTEDAYHYY